jgi:hypothetical protein
LQTPEVLVEVEAEKAIEQANYLAAAESEVGCRTCRQRSFLPNGQLARGQAAKFSCGNCGHFTLYPLWSPQRLRELRAKSA